MGKGAVTGGDVAVCQEKGGPVRMEGETVWLSLAQMAAIVWPRCGPAAASVMSRRS
jgi:hypothetical protein